MDNPILSELNKRLGEGRVKQNFILAPFTTFKMGGPAQFYFEAQTDADLIAAVKVAHELDLALTILGGASNVVVSDSGIKGLVIRNQSVYKEIVREEADYILLKVSSGYAITRLAKETAEAGWSGFEYHLGLPGTVGGAICMNAKWTKPHAYVGDNLVEAYIVDREGQARTVDADYLQFSYGKSKLQQTKEIIIWAIFKLEKKDSQELLKRAQEALNYRRETQPFGVATSGCFFWNADGESAGKIIDKLGLKGYTIGDLEISDKHANFVINKGNGTEEDFRALIAMIKKKAKATFGISLEEEVRFLK